MNPLAKLTLGAAASLAALVAALPESGTSRSAPSLTVLCAASLRGPMEVAARRYQQQTGVAIQIQYGGSNTLLGQLAFARHADLFLPADELYLQLADRRGLVATTQPLVRMSPVVAVPRGEGGRVRGVEDLATLRLALGNPDQTAVGAATHVLLQRAGVWRAVDEQVRRRGVYKPAVGEVASDVALGAVDAGIVWDAVAAQHPGLEAIRLPELDGGATRVVAGRLTTSQTPIAADRFLVYLADPKRGLAAFFERGFTPAATDSSGGVSE